MLQSFPVSRKAALEHFHQTMGPVLKEPRPALINTPAVDFPDLFAANHQTHAP
jgi:hypothetical protein